MIPNETKRATSRLKTEQFSWFSHGTWVALIADVLRWLLTLALLSALGLACAVSPQPTPPNLDPQRITGTGGPEAVSQPTVLGAAGAVEPAEGAVVLTNLDRDIAPVAERVRADGSFVVTIAGAFTDELRLQVRSGDVRSEPLDIVTIDGEVYMEAERPLGCFTTDPTWELDFGVVRGTRRDTIELRNDCPDRVELSTRFRMGSTAFSLEGMPTGVDPGERVEVTVIATAPTGAIDEETLLIETSVPMVDRRPITLFVQRSSD